MNPTQITASLATSAIVMCILATVSSTPLTNVVEPVQPFFALGELDPYEACLFSCNFCFTRIEDTDKLLHCSNQICSLLLEGKCSFKEFMWLGNRCENFDMVESMWHPKPKDNKGYKLH